MTNEQAKNIIESCDGIMWNRLTDAEYEALSMAIEALSAQAEIIRCKDCKEYQTDWKPSSYPKHFCATMDSMMPEDGFCSYAERRTDEK